MYIVEYYRTYNNRLYNPCGIDYTLIVKDLKTLEGVKKRAERNLPADVVYYEISKTDNIYCRRNYKKEYSKTIDNIDNIEEI